MRKRRSWKRVEQDYKHAFKCPEPAAKAGQQPIKPWLTMTDSEIDQTYYHLGTRGRSQLKREAAAARLRAQAQQQLKGDQSDERK